MAEVLTHFDRIVPTTELCCKRPSDHGISTRQSSQTLYLRFLVNEIYEEVTSDAFSVHDFALVRFSFKRVNYCTYSKISLKKHETAKDLHVSLQVNGVGFDYNEIHNCLEDWSNFKQINYREPSIFEFEISVRLTVNKVDSMITKLYKDQNLTDFQLKAKDGSVNFHKIILAVNSDVFQTMLNGEWKETAQNCVEVEGATLQSLQHLKDYLYLGTLPDDGLEPLLLIARCYLMENLVKECIMKLIQTVKADNLYSLLDFAIANDIKELRNNIIQLTPCEIAQSAYEMVKNKQICKSDGEEDDEE